MRLIDADEALNLIDGETKVETNSNVKAFNDALEVAIQIIDTQKTVAAIPIEWLHSIMERQLIFAMKSEMEGTTTVKDGVIHCVSGALACQVLANVIELWEKESEID